VGDEEEKYGKLSSGDRPWWENEQRGHPRKITIKSWESLIAFAGRRRKHLGM
jgi:hypothetical protein